MKKVIVPDSTRVSKRHSAHTAKALLAANPFNLTPADIVTDEGDMNTNPEGIDTPPMGVVESSFIHSETTEKETPMETTETSEYTETDFTKKEPTVQEAKAAAAQAKMATKKAKLEEAAAKKQAAADAKAEKAIAAAAAKDAKLLAKKEAVTIDPAVKAEREAAKLERQARIAALGEGETRTYHGSMLSLADRVKQGAYVKSATGQLNCADALATVLTAVPVDNVIELGKIVLGLEVNPYVHLNMGQQSMNLRNKMRGAITKGTLSIEAIQAAIGANGFATATDWEAKKQAAKVEREAKAAAAKAEKEAAAKAKAAAKAEKEEAVPA